MMVRRFLAVALAATCSWAVPDWFPRAFTPLPVPGPEMAKYLHAEQLDFADSLHWAGTVECDAMRLVVHSWIPPRAAGTVFLVHGFYSQSGLWSEHIERLLARNLAVVAFDLPGHGLSDGARMDVDSFGQYAKGLRAVEDSLASMAPKPWSLVGHSLGGGIALERAEHGTFPYTKVLLLSPMLRYRGWGWIGAVLPVVAAVKPYMARKKNPVSSSDSTFLRRVRSDPLEGWQTSTHWLKVVRIWSVQLKPVDRPGTQWMLLQGGLDQTVDFQWGNAWLKANVPRIQMRWFPLARHHVHNEGGATGTKAREIFDDFLAPGLHNSGKLRYP